MMVGSNDGLKHEMGFNTKKKTDRKDITEISLKVALNTTTFTLK